VLIPGLLHGAYYAGAMSTLHIKPADNPAYFKAKAKISALGPAKDLWAGLSSIWFAPTQILVSYFMGQQTGVSSITVELHGRNQFGYRVSERLTLTTTTITTSPAVLVSRQGTRNCYVHLESMILVEHINPDTSPFNPLDFYSLGIGASGDDAATFPPMEKNSYRLPLAARLLDSFQVNFVQDVGGTLGATGVRDLWGYTGNLLVDLASSCAQTEETAGVSHPSSVTYFIINLNRKRCFMNQARGPDEEDPCEFTPGPTSP